MHFCAVPLRALVVLVTSADGTLRAERADAAWAAARLARTAGYERRELFALRANLGVLRVQGVGSKK